MVAYEVLVVIISSHTSLLDSTVLGIQMADVDAVAIGHPADGQIA